MKQARQILLLILLAGAFAFGVWKLFALRFEKGDVYPAYSSLRSDPLGTMVLFESLDRLPNIEPRRDFTAQNRLPDGRQTAYLHLAARSYDWTRLDEKLFDEIESFAIRGGRMVIAFYPEPAKPYRYGVTNSHAGKPQQKSAPPSKKKEADRDEYGPHTVSLKDRWGLALKHVPLARGEDDTYLKAEAENVSELPLPNTLDWHSGLVLTGVDPAWKTIYARGPDSVMVERRWGAGSIVLVTDCYFVSNEALSKDRHAELLAWLVSPARTVYFDEAHLGLVETPGVSGLMRKYHLYWVILAVLVLAVLFIWKTSARFVPPLPPELPPGYVAGKDNTAGFLNLLRRNVPSKELLRLCLDEWAKSIPRKSSHLAARAVKAQELVREDEARRLRDRRPVQTYREICELLKTRTGPTADGNVRAPSAGQGESANNVYE